MRASRFWHFTFGRSLLISPAGIQVMPELIELLDISLRESHFDSGRYGRYGATEMRAMHGQVDPMSMITSRVARAVIPETRLSQLTERLGREMNDYVEPDTQCFGTGLIALLGGGALDLIKPTITELARTLVGAGSILGSARAVEILRGWIAGEPYRFRTMMLLTGGRCEQPLVLEEGVRVLALPRSADELPSFLPFSSVLPESNIFNFLGRTVLAIDGTASPALYLPAPGEGDRNGANSAEAKA